MRSKNIDGYEGYVIYEDGRVFSTKSNRFLSPRLRGVKRRQYQSVALYGRDRKAKEKSIHILVAQAFLPNPDNKPIVNHKDNNPLNNHVSNLEWCTYTENTLHSYNETKRKRVGRSVLQIDGAIVIEEYKSIAEAGRAVGVHPTTISHVLKGNRKTAGGYTWRYKEGND